MQIITLKNINKKYKNDTILKDINLEIKEKTMYSIRGESGAGKSTLLNILGLLDKPTSGEIIIKNKSVARLNESELAKVRMEQLGFIFQSFYLNPKLKAYENVEVAMYINTKLTKTQIHDRAIKLLEELGLGHRINHYPSELSGGEQQRVAIARALANDPACILADEPTGNLDKKNEEIVMNYLKSLVDKGKSVVIVTHSDKVSEYADKVYHIEDGSLRGV